MYEDGLGADPAPAAESPFVTAHYAGRCRCGRPIMPGDTIGFDGEEWAHARCLR